MHFTAAASSSSSSTSFSYSHKMRKTSLRFVADQVRILGVGEVDHDHEDRKQIRGSGESSSNWLQLGLGFNSTAAKNGLQQDHQCLNATDINCPKILRLHDEIDQLGGLGLQLGLGVVVVDHNLGVKGGTGNLGFHEEITNGAVMPSSYNNEEDVAPILGHNYNDNKYDNKLWQDDDGDGDGDGDHDLIKYDDDDDDEMVVPLVHDMDISGGFLDWKNTTKTLFNDSHDYSTPTTRPHPAGLWFTLLSCTNR